MTHRARRDAASTLDRLDEPEARAALARCCGSSTWVEEMLALRPFVTEAELLNAAERVWWGLREERWREAFRHHPRIGERAPDDAGTSALSRSEQAGVATADEETRRALAEGNRAYEARFGHVFLTRAAGRSAEEMLGELGRRLANDPATELRIAAAHQAAITRLRLGKLEEG